MTIKFGALLLLVFGFAACSSSNTTEIPDGGAQPDAAAVVDRCTDEAPCALTPGTMDSEYVFPAKDEDPWTFNVTTGGQVVHLLVTNDADFSPIRLEVALFDPAGTALMTKSFQGNGKQRVDIQLVAAMAGQYKVLVRDNANDAADSRHPYFITVSLLSDMDLNEPNNDAAHAVLLAAGMPKSGNIGSQGDEDWFAVDVPANQLVNISLSFATPPASGGVKLKYVLWDPTAMTPIAESVEPGGAVTSLTENRAVGNAAGRYLIQVIDDPSDGMQADLSRTYVLTASLEPEPDVQDLAAPNEYYGTATTVQAGQTVTGYIAAKADADFYAIRVPTNNPTLITAEVTMDPNSPVDISIEVLGIDGRTEVCADEAECKAFRFVPENSARRPTTLATSHVVRGSGRYFVVVRDFQDNEYDTSKPYTLKIDLPPEPDANELYETSRDQARVIGAATSTAGTTIQFPWVEGYISYANDTDWYSFNIPGPMGAARGQNGDWLVQFEIQKPGPTPVEMQLFFSASDLDYGGYGKSCMMPPEGDPDPTGLYCQYGDAENAIDETFGEAHGDCIVVFREHTRVGPHFVRITDLNHDDFDVRPGMGAYRFRVTLTAKCTLQSHCAGMYTDVNGGDLCARP